MHWLCSLSPLVILEFLIKGNIQRASKNMIFTFFPLSFSCRCAEVAWQLLASLGFAVKPPPCADLLSKNNHSTWLFTKATAQQSLAGLSCFLGQILWGGGFPLEHKWDNEKMLAPFVMPSTLQSASCASHLISGRDYRNECVRDWEEGARALITTLLFLMALSIEYLPMAHRATENLFQRLEWIESYRHLIACVSLCVWVG